MEKIRYASIVGHDGYKVGTDGTVWSCWERNGPEVIRTHRWHVLTPYVNELGYNAVQLGQGRPYLVHRLVLDTFVGPCPPRHQARHLDGNPRNNWLANLAWGTARENAADRDRHGTTARGSRNGCAKMTEADVLLARALFKARAATQAELARRFGITQAGMSLILKRQKWAHLKEEDEPAVTATPRCAGRPLTQGSRHVRAKLTEDDVREIRRLYLAGGITHKELARRYDVDRSVIGAIISGKAWKHVKDEGEPVASAETATA